MKQPMKRLRVPEPIANRLKSEAASQGLTLQKYLALKLGDDCKKEKDMGGYRGVF